jgi:hypothetical protein
MIRTILASPWLPLLYWTAAVIAMFCGVHESLKRRPNPQQNQMLLSASTPTPGQFQDHSSTPLPDPPKRAIATACQPTCVWYPLFFGLQKSDLSRQKLVTAGATSKRLVSTEAQISACAPTTMLSIRLDPLQKSMAKTLAIQCRTSVAFSNAHGKAVSIHGIVTEEVVSSTGKILIMAGSRVVGSGLLDPENGRFKSDGLWSIFFDQTELKVQAQLLDRPEGLPGILGQERLHEDEPLPAKALKRDGPSIIVPRNAPFVLEIRGEIQLRDLKSDEASN